MRGNGKVSRGVETADEWARNDTNCREMEKHSRETKRKGKAMFREGMEVIRFDQRGDGVELIGKAQQRSRNAGQRGEMAI